MGLKLTLEWFRKSDEIFVGEETSTDLGNDGSIIKKFGLPFDGRIYDGGFDVLASWIPAFPDAKTAKKRTPVKGGGTLRSSWKDSKGRIFEWDSQHGTVEMYDRSGRNHLGEFDPVSGEQTKPADPTRRVEK